MADPNSTISIKTSSIQGDYIILTIEKIGVNIKRVMGKQERTAWVSFVPSENEELKVYQAIVPGAKTAPTDAIALIQIQDIVRNLGTEIEQALNRLENDEADKSKEGWK